MYRVSPFVRHFAWAFLGGSAVATAWVTLSPASYYDMIEARLIDGARLAATPLAQVIPESALVTPVTLVSDGLMALFLFFIGKELWESLVLERGALRGRQALVPGSAVLGGMIGAAGFWMLWARFFETAEEAGPLTGWTVPLGSDIVLGYVIGRAVFGAAHPALHLLLLTGIASTIAGLAVQGLAEAGTGPHLWWLVLPLVAAVGVWLAYGRTNPRAPERVRRRSLALWPYVLAGLASWIGVAMAGLPPALGLLPVIPAIPHADRAFGLFAEAEEFLHDPLNQLSHLCVRPLAVILFAFGLTRGGIDLMALAPTTGSILAALWLGKPLGMLLGGLLVALVLRADLPRGVRLRDFAAVAVISGVGFTPALMTLDSGLPGGAMAEAARLGAALSLLLWPVVVLAGLMGLSKAK